MKPPHLGGNHETMKFTRKPPHLEANHKAIRWGSPGGDTVNPGLLTT
jgi:hypothetical protein